MVIVTSNPMAARRPTIKVKSSIASMTTFGPSFLVFQIGQEKSLRLRVANLVAWSVLGYCTLVAYLASLGRSTVLVLEVCAPERAACFSAWCLVQAPDQLGPSLALPWGGLEHEEEDEKPTDRSIHQVLVRSQLSARGSRAPLRMSPPSSP